MSIFEGFPRGGPGSDNRGAPLGTAQWRSHAPLWQPGMVLLGRDGEGREVGYLDDRHLITVAGSRAGKGRSVIIPNLLRWPGSCVVIDPKGEIASNTAERREGLPGHKVVVLDPRGCAAVPDDLRGSFNPLDLIDADDDEAIDLAAAIGDAMMIGSGDGKDVHWTESALQIVVGVLLHVAVTEQGEQRSLVRVRQLLTQGDRDAAARFNAERVEAGLDADVSPFDALWTVMADSEAPNRAVRDVIAGAACSITDMGDNERGSVLSTARRNTAFTQSGWMADALQASAGRTLDIDALKAAPGGLTIYVCLPARFIPTHARFLRLVLNLILYRMEAQGLDRPACGHPVLFILDEFAALGRLESIEKAAGLMAGFGVKLWPFLQDLGQIKRHYKESWETFMGNAGVLQFFANADMTTLEWLSKRLGETEVIRETRGHTSGTTTSLSKSQGRTEQSGWSKTTGQNTGTSDMADLQRMAAREGGQGLVPFLARANANAVAHSQGASMQDGVSGGETTQHGDSSTAGTSDSATTSEAIHKTALMTPDELARTFDRGTGRQVTLIGGHTVALIQTTWNDATRSL